MKWTIAFLITAASCLVPLPEPVVITVPEIEALVKQAEAEGDLTRANHLRWMASQLKME